MKAESRKERRLYPSRSRRHTLLVRLMWEDEDFLCEGTVQDISTGGISLLLQRQFKPGTTFAVGPVRGGQPAPLLVRVVHVSRRPKRWHCGCEFISPLNQEELRGLLG